MPTKRVKSRLVFILIWVVTIAVQSPSLFGMELIAPGCGTIFPDRGGNAISKGSRPAYDYSIQSSKKPVVVHAKHITTREYAGRILSYVEQSWDVIIGKMRFKEPLADHGEESDDRIDIYIANDLTPGIGGYTGFTGFDESTPETDAYGYLVIADNLLDTYIRGVVAHEFFHLSQMAYDWFEHPGFMEATAVWITDHVFDDENFYFQYYRYFNKSPNQALDHISLADPFQYGAGLWFQFLDEIYGIGDGTVVRYLWENSVQTALQNVPNYFEAMAQFLGGIRPLAWTFREFGRWRLFIGKYAGDAHLRESNTWPDTVIPAMVELGQFQPNTPTNWSIPNGMQPFSHAYLRMTGVPDSQHLNLSISIAGETTTGTSAVSVDEIHLPAGERVFVLTRAPTDTYNPDTSPEETIEVSGVIGSL